MGSLHKIVTADEMDVMTPQQRADIIDASVLRSWDEVEAGFREQALETAQVLNAQQRNDA